MSKPSPLEFVIVPSLKDIPESDWDALFEPRIIEGYQYQKTLEEASLKEFTFGYLLGKRQEKIVFILPFFIMDFALNTLIQGLLHKLLQRIPRRFFTMRILFLGSPTAEELYLGILKNEELEPLLDCALAKLSSFCRQKKIAGFLFNNLYGGNRRLMDYLEKKGFIKMEGLHNTQLEIREKTLEGYLKNLRPNMRKDLRRKLKKSAARVCLRTQLREDISDILPEIYKLYLNNFSDSDVHFEILTQEFFQHICRNMRGVAKCFVTYDRDKIVAFNLFMAKDGLFIDKFIGFDLEVAHQYHLYFTTFCHNLQWCMQNGFRIYQPGITDYHPKVRLGAELIPLYIYAKAFNPFLGCLIRLIGPWIQPKNLDSSLKEIEKSKKIRQE